MRISPRRLVVPLAVLFLAALAAWQYRASSADAYATTASLQQDGYEIRIESSAAEAATMKPALFRIEARRLDGGAVDIEDARMKIEMPGMFCGVFRAELTRLGPDRYEASVIPVMNGVWEAEAVVRIDDRAYAIKHRFKAVA